MSSTPTSPAPVSTQPELVNIVVDGKKLQVPKGMNIIQAAEQAGVEIPHYCYHPHLSVAGNCRMCQVKVKGMPKLEIACNMAAREGLEVETHQTSPEVKAAQEAVLEFILINHPLDCTVCDQAGHCKLQDYHYEYNARESRFVEDKEHKVKAEVLGPNVILDGERCIMCTRCIRFCDEVTQTSELGMLNRGDRSVIAISPNKPLDNALSSSVVDLCPVGALTHREWRFNTRIWFTKQVDSICPGCSTGCNTRVANRDDEIVQVKARLNAAVNQEWMCDEGRYGFHRFLPESRLTAAEVSGKTSSLDAAISSLKQIFNADLSVLISPDLVLEDYWILKELLNKLAPQARVSIAYRERKLSSVEAKLISPDYAANFRAAQEIFGLGSDLEARYSAALNAIKQGEVGNLLIVGDRAVLKEDRANGMLAKVKRVAALLSDSQHELRSSCEVVLPSATILERSGLMVNRKGRLQYSQAVIPTPPPGAQQAWEIFAKLLAGDFAKINGERELTLKVLSSAPFNGLTLAQIKAGGVALYAGAA